MPYSNKYNPSTLYDLSRKPTWEPDPFLRQHPHNQQVVRTSPPSPSCNMVLLPLPHPLNRMRILHQFPRQERRLLQHLRAVVQNSLVPGTRLVDNL